jgi:hypothetical protein
VIGEDAAGNPPSKAYCLNYAQTKGVPAERVFMDNDGAAWGSTLYFINNYAQGSFGIPWNAVLDGKSMEYVHSDTAGDGTRAAVLEGLYEAFAAESE